MALSKIDTPAIADAAVTDAKSAVDLSALATQANLDAAEATIASLRSDIGSLALQSARADNQAAFNLGNSFVDQFENDSGIDSLSGLSRDPGEYISSFGVDTTQQVQIAQSNVTTAASNGTRELGPGSAFDGIRGGANYQAGVRADPSNIGWYISADWGAGNTYRVVGFKIWGVQGYGIAGNTASRFGKFQGSNDNSNWTTLYTIADVARNGDTYSLSLSNSQTYPAHDIDLNASNFDRNNSYRYHRMLFEGDGNGGTVSELEFYEYAGLGNTSGNFTGVTQTAASSVSEMSIVVLYEDNAGTATLNTDITAEVSANNGADWSTVTLAPAGSFSANLKLSKSAPVSVTAGTQPKYRINFANQASGSKVTRIQGVALVD